MLRLLFGRCEPPLDPPPIRENSGPPCFEPIHSASRSFGYVKQDRLSKPTLLVDFNPPLPKRDLVEQYAVLANVDLRSPTSAGKSTDLRRKVANKGWRLQTNDHEVRDVALSDNGRNVVCQFQSTVSPSVAEILRAIVRERQSSKRSKRVSGMHPFGGVHSLN